MDAYYSGLKTLVGIGEHLAKHGSGRRQLQQQYYPPRKRDALYNFKNPNSLKYAPKRDMYDRTLRRLLDEEEKRREIKRFKY